MAAGRLIVVSNRLPVTLKRDAGEWRAVQSSGGLATAMGPILKDRGGLWVGWSGEDEFIDPKLRDGLLAPAAPGYGLIPIDTAPEEATEFYEGFPNQAIWPLFHSFPMSMRFESGAWESYVEGNRRFCDAVSGVAREGDLIWVHDYHLMLLPRMLRERLPGARVGFFLHIPFPPSELFSALPRCDEVLTGLLGADLIAFHTHRHLHHFRSSLLRVTGLESAINAMEYGNRTIRLDAMPIGIAPEEWLGLLREDVKTAEYVRTFRREYEGRQVVVAVDRLDYTKGLPQRLRAFRQMLKTDPSATRRVVLLQVAVPSREGLESYQALRDEVNQLVGEINGQFGTPDWTPVVYINRALDRRELAALYSLADAACVTPLRDGMNLVAKEYCACKPGGDGALVLSEFAGAAAEMGEAILVNPYDEERVAEALIQALDAEAPQRCERMKALHDRVLRRDVYKWAAEFVGALEESPAVGSSSAVPLEEGFLRDAYRRARRRLIVLDYDGTLTGYVNDPRRAVPSGRVLRILERLAAYAENGVALVSGRRAADLERWFGGIPGLILAAEHAAVIRLAGEKWEPLFPGQSSGDWKEQVRPILDHFADRTPGSFVEEKEYSLVWHYRMAEPEFGEWLAGELVALLEGMLANTDARPVRGRKSVEIRPVWAGKGEFVGWLEQRLPESTFRLAAGDDRTDEDMFARMPEGAITVRVGGGSTRARFRCAAPEVFVDLLATMAGDA